MAEHMRIMEELLKDRENPVTKRSVAKLNGGKLRVELEARPCSTAGTDASLRDRLLWAVMREDEHQTTRVPWYKWDAEGVERQELQRRGQVL